MLEEVMCGVGLIQHQRHGQKQLIALGTSWWYHSVPVVWDPFKLGTLQSSVVEVHTFGVGAAVEANGSMDLSIAVWVHTTHPMQPVNVLCGQSHVFVLPHDL